MANSEQATPLWRIVLDKYILPLLVIVTTFLAAGLYSMRRDIDRVNWDVDHIKEVSEQHNAAFEKFKSPGDRFTAADGARFDERIKKLEGECERCRESRIEVLQRLAQIEKEQERLCQRIAHCDRPGAPAPRPWPPSQ